MDAPPAPTFAALDGLAFAAARNRLGALPTGTVCAGRALGPFLEPSQLARGGLLSRPGDASRHWADAVEKLFGLRRSSFS